MQSQNRHGSRRQTGETNSACGALHGPVAARLPSVQDVPKHACRLGMRQVGSSSVCGARMSSVLWARPGVRYMQRHGDSRTPRLPVSHRATASGRNAAVLLRLESGASSSRWWVARPVPLLRRGYALHRTSVIPTRSRRGAATDVCPSIEAAKRGRPEEDVRRQKEEGVN